MSDAHDHGASLANEKPLWLALGLATTFRIAEVVLGENHRWSAQVLRQISISGEIKAYV